MSLNRDLDALYATAPEGFTAARDALAKKLKDGGDAGTAKEVKALRRPSVAAWGLNRLVRSGGGVEELLDLARDLRKAQRGALSGLRGSALREGIKRRRSVVDRLADAAVELLNEEGRNGATHREAIVRTLEAATADEQAAEAVRSGRLERELARPSGFGDLTGLVALQGGGDDDAEVSTEPSERAARPKPKARPQPPKEDPRLKRLRVQRDEAADEARGAAKAAVRAGERAVTAGAHAEKARAEIDRLERDLRAAKRRERSASETAVQAGADAKRADQSAERAKKRVEDLQARLEKLLDITQT